MCFIFIGISLPLFFFHNRKIVIFQEILHRGSLYIVPISFSICIKKVELPKLQEIKISNTNAFHIVHKQCKNKITV